MKNNIYITNYWYAKNYGACLTAFALYKTYQNFGLNPILAENMPPIEKILYKNSFNKKFVENNCAVSNISYIKNNIDEKSILTTGSDQVFNPMLAKERLDDYLLEFGDISTKRIAISVSFGANKEEFIQKHSMHTINKMKYALKSFDFVSVREKSGLALCKELFDVDAEWIIDPVFMLNKFDYNEICKNNDNLANDKIVTYVMDSTKENFNQAYKFLSKKYKAEIYKLDNFNHTLDEWVSAIKKCRLFVTDSFHGMCIALIFNKPFILVANKGTRNNRFDSLFEMLNIQNQSINSIKEVYKKDCIFKINFKQVNENIENERKKGLDFIKKAIESPVTNIQEKTNLRIKYLEQRIIELEEQNNVSYQLKKYFWENWLIIYHCYLPKFLRNIISYFWQKIKDKNNA